MVTWKIRSAELRRRRIERIMTIAELARLAIVSVRTIQALEKSDLKVTVATVDGLARALGCQRADIATAIVASNAAPPKSAPRKLDGAKTSAPGERVRMPDLIAIGRTLPEPEPVEIDGELIAVLTVLKYNQCFSAYVARHGERYAIEGMVESDHGLTPAEAALLGARSGESARFEIRVPVGDDGHTLCVTVHTDRAVTTIDMQDAAHKTALCVVRLVALDDLRAGEGLTCFMRERPSPWCLIVEQVVRVANPRAKVARTKTTSRARARR